MATVGLTGSTPVVFAGDAPAVLSLEFDLPVAFDGALPPVPIEQEFDVPVSFDGLSPFIVRHTSSVYRALRSRVPHTTFIIETRLFSSVRHTSVVLRLLTSVRHTTVILDEELLISFGTDMQLPFGHAEKHDADD